MEKSTVIRIFETTKSCDMLLISKRSNLYLLLIALVLIFIAILVFLPVFQLNQSAFSVAISLDLIVTVPFLYYLWIKDREIPKYTVLSVGLIGLIISSIIIPTENQSHIVLIRNYFVPIIELFVIGLVTFKFSVIYRKYNKSHLRKELDFYDLLLESCCEVFPERIGRILTTEIAVFYYAFFPQYDLPDSDFSYTYFKRNRIRTTISALLFIILIEAVTIHLVLHPIAPSLAWILSFLSIYTAIQVVALIRSIPQRLNSINIEEGFLTLRFGFVAEAVIPFSSIDRIEYNAKALPMDNTVAQLSPFGILDSHNLVIHLNEEREILKLYGFTKKYTLLAIYIDEKEAFKELLETYTR